MKEARRYSIGNWAGSDGKPSTIRDDVLKVVIQTET